MVLQAYDGMLAGASQREIATTIFGEEHVCADWEAGYLRTRVQRLIRTAEKMIAGGYRVLLQSAEAALKSQLFRGAGTSRSPAGGFGHLATIMAAAMGEGRLCVDDWNTAWRKPEAN